LAWLRDLQDLLAGGAEGPGLFTGSLGGGLRWLLQESKWAGAVALGAVCLERMADRSVAARTHTAPGPTERSASV
jgi:hypothetical protein